MAFNINTGEEKEGSGKVESSFAGNSVRQNFTIRDRNTCPGQAARVGRGTALYGSATRRTRPPAACVVSRGLRRGSRDVWDKERPRPLAGGRLAQSRQNYEVSSLVAAMYRERSERNNESAEQKKVSASNDYISSKVLFH
ncbi:hypothetical protein EVAR_87232_1 [Eumeta japonica]|uniref:Uncharacterized protein n=1 Tax=Eumeta variegata TaxID=151549 RepID=A0A4C1ZQU5_EUMVA|nr:hypothetical protein EVAR_87232_1 [Eumeta japonica]